VARGVSVYRCELRTDEVRAFLSEGLTFPKMLSSRPFLGFSQFINPVSAFYFSTSFPSSLGAPSR
jgi:hypothetical protein